MDDILTLLLKAPIARVAWLPPHDRFIKINTDASFDDKTMRSAGGGVLRDSLGRVLAMFLCEFKDMKCPLEAELEALELGMFVALRLNVRRPCFEVDNLDIANYLRSRRDIPPKHLMKFM
ncbi:hypothetical protein Vadar_024318 [Vaccinium darrowii]|uniref:Uncharacterized protein n=1 Tax=Vaccinium darrowii TaxID=229202 RepID=A0ACB7Y264_9ERIC|nr:hypothetical protein Vadar_024318 [Vaccinium darrowii]